MPSKKTIWMIAMDCSSPEDGPHNRHFWLAKHLKAKGNDVVVFVASRERGSSTQKITDKSPHLIDETYGFPLVYIRIRDYGESMKRRIAAIVSFHARLEKYSNWFAGQFGRPDVILGSSGYPLSPWLAYRFARRFDAKSICEIRDLWPYSLEEHGIIRRGGFIAKSMYRLERSNYENADAIIFLMEGGAKYIQDKKWDKDSGGSIDLAKVHHINNGVDLGAFERDRVASREIAEDFETNEKLQIIYAGSIRRANNVGYLVDVANYMRSDDDIEFIVLGDGDELDELQERAARLRLDNLEFKGAVKKCEVPAYLEKASILLLLYSKSQVNLARYGMSQNKLFDYLASGKPVLSNLPSSYSIINRYNCGVERAFAGPEDFADQIRRMLSDRVSMKQWGENARSTAELYSYISHTDRLIDVIEETTKEEQ